jgi:predicted nucleic acid-binding protein
MITAVDTNVVLDVLVGDVTFGPGSRRAISACRATGSLVACEVVWAEIAAAYADASQAASALAALGIEFRPLQQQDAEQAGVVWRRYRQARGPRERMLPDFLIAAHASTSADRFLTRDRGFYRRYFDGLQLLDPAQT